MISKIVQCWEHQIVLKLRICYPWAIFVMLLMDCLFLVENDMILNKISIVSSAEKHIYFLPWRNCWDFIENNNILNKKTYINPNSWKKARWTIVVLKSSYCIQVENVRIYTMCLQGHFCLFFCKCYDSQLYLEHFSSGTANLHFEYICWECYNSQ